VEEGYGGTQDVVRTVRRDTVRRQVGKDGGLGREEESGRPVDS